MYFGWFMIWLGVIFLLLSFWPELHYLFSTARMFRRRPMLRGFRPEKPVYDPPHYWVDRFMAVLSVAMMMIGWLHLKIG